MATAGDWPVAVAGDAVVGRACRAEVDPHAGLVARHGRHVRDHVAGDDGATLMGVEMSGVGDEASAIPMFCNIVMRANRAESVWVYVSAIWSSVVRVPATASTATIRFTSPACFAGIYAFTLLSDYNST